MNEPVAPSVFDTSGTWKLTGTELTAREHAAWEAGMRHALTWLGLKQYGDVMALDNPHKGSA